MLKQCIYVNVVGFSEVERHALNTVFRLSADQDVAFVPWEPSEAKGDMPVLMTAEVALVDGDCAEAVVSKAKAMPVGQRLIWVGSDPPAHAWRVWSRPIRWANAVHDLVALVAARQADSGFLDFDVTSPQPLFVESGESAPVVRRALLAGVKGGDLAALRANLNAEGVSELDETYANGSAAELIGRNPYCCGVFNLDDDHLDAWALSRHFAERHPGAMTLGVTHQIGPLAGWWLKRLVRHESQKMGVNALLALPLQASELAQCLERLR